MKTNMSKVRNGLILNAGLIERLAASSPFGMPRVAIEAKTPVDSAVQCVITLPAPCGQEVTVRAWARYGEWGAEVSGSSYRMGSLSDLRNFAAVLVLAGTISDLLNSMKN